MNKFTDQCSILRDFKARSLHILSDHNVVSFTDYNIEYILHILLVVDSLEECGVCERLLSDWSSLHTRQIESLERTGSAEIRSVH